MLKINILKEELVNSLLSKLENTKYKKHLNQLTKIKEKHPDITTYLDTQKLLHMSSNKMATVLNIKFSTIVQVKKQLLKEINLLLNTRELDN